jgi:hypothetical protein
MGVDGRRPRGPAIVLKNPTIASQIASPFDAVILSLGCGRGNGSSPEKVELSTGNYFLQFIRFSLTGKVFKIRKSS